jgi:hypothetical protein
MALWREWSVGIQAGITTITINHYMEQDGFLLMSTAVRMNSGVKIGHNPDDIIDLDGYLSAEWSAGIIGAIRERLRVNSETPDYSVAQVRTATIPILGPEDTAVQII